MKKGRAACRPTPHRVVIALAAGALAAATAGCLHRPAHRIEPGALNGAEDAQVPRPVRCRVVTGGSWTAADDARLAAIVSDTTAPPAGRAARVRAAWPALTTFEPIEARACRLLASGRAHGGEYEAFVDSVVPRVLDAAGPVSAADSVFRARQPRLRTPPPGAVFAQSPRRTVVSWDSVPGARHYVLEVQALVPVYRRAANGGVPVFDHSEWMPHGEGLHSAVTPQARALFYFIGAQPGRWRVRAISPSGVASRPSEWREFTHTR